MNTTDPACQTTAADWRVLNGDDVPPERREASPAKRTDLISVTLSGTTVSWLYDSTSWGDPHSPSEDATAKSARTKVMSGKEIRRGKGYQYRVALDLAEVESLFGILDSIAGAWESMAAEEKDGDYRYRALRRDAERIRPLVEGAP